MVIFFGISEASPVDGGFIYVCEVHPLVGMIFEDLTKNVSLGEAPPS